MYKHCPNVAFIKSWIYALYTVVYIHMAIILRLKYNKRYLFIYTYGYQIIFTKDIHIQIVLQSVVTSSVDQWYHFVTTPKVPRNFYWFIYSCTHILNNWWVRVQCEIVKTGSYEWMSFNFQMPKLGSQRSQVLDSKKGSKITRVPTNFNPVGRGIKIKLSENPKT